MTAPWATSPWATSAFGGGTSPVVVVAAYATSTHDVLVRFTGALQAVAPTVVGDATAITTWRVVRLDTDVILPVSAVTVVDPQTVSLSVLPALPPATAQLEVRFPNLRDAAGGLLALPRAADFVGVVDAQLATPELAVVGQVQGSRDLLNQTITSVDGSLSGTLVVKGGDYVNQSGTSLLRKLILRRIIATPGDFWHIPQYGVGLRLKGTYSPGDVVKMQAAIQAQVMLERDVASVKASAVLDPARGILTISVTVVTASTGETIGVGLKLPLGGT